jgi:excisionase family DNA binding protein
MSASLLTTAQAAKELRLTVRAVQKMIQHERLEAVKVGRDYLIKADALSRIKRESNAGRPPKSQKSTKRKK